MHDALSPPFPFFEPVFPDRGLLSGQDQERTDQLPAADAFALSPFQYSTLDQRLPELHNAPPSASGIDPQILKRLRRLRKSPGFALLADSVLLLQSVQLDMDYPKPWHHYARQRLSAWLLELAGTPLNPDALKLHLNSPHAWVDGQGVEQHSLECSLTELAIASASMQQLSALAHCFPANDQPLPELPQLTATALLRQVLDNRWFDDYQQQLEAFWQRHTGTWLNLARLSFLDGLARQRTRKTLSHAGLYLTLDALGYPAFPTDSQALKPGDPGDKAEVRLLYIDDEVVPGLFQIRSRLNSHCFIHLPGTAKETVEYISADSTVMTARLLDAVNGSKWHRQWLDGRQTLHDRSPRIESRPFMGDVFNELLLAARDCAEQPPDPHGNSLLYRFIARGMTLASAVDLWQATPDILDDLPSPDDVAAERMKHWLHEQQGLDLDPHLVFIAYRPGSSRTPLGQVNHANTYVHVPDETPLSLSKALIGFYQIESPSGYIDHGAQTVVYHDPSGQGKWAEDRVLPVSAIALCTYIEQVDFLAVMTRRIDEFWAQQQGKIEQALRTLLITQAVISLKHGTLQRSGFDAVVLGLNSMMPCWRALGFEVQSSFIEGLTRQPCASLLILCPADTQRRVLYQAGQHKAFIEFENNDALSAYLRTAAASEHWRNAVLHYVPTRHRERLAWLFKYWSGITPASPAASMLRPWTDVIYHPDAHQTLDHSLHQHALPPGPPMHFMHQTLKANALEDARQLIVTSRQASLQYWSARALHLQWLLAPMSLLLTPALIASLATEAGLLALNIAQANLPGHRQAEKRQVLLSMLSLGVLGLAPYTPRLLGALNKLSSTSKVALRAPLASVQPVGLGAWLRRSLHPRQTRLEKFFHTDSLLKRWTVHPHPYFGGQPVHAWKLGRKFLLWTSDRGQARTLVVSTHGYYLPWSKTVPIPNGTHIHTYAPHGHTLIDPALHRVVSQRVSPFGISSAAGNTQSIPGATLPPLLPTDKLVAGTDLPGRLKNYTLAKFQTPGGENYQEIARVVRSSHNSLLAGQLPSAPMDVLSVRNRFGSTSPTLADLFENLASQGIHYDRILLLHCRCAAISALLRRAPVWTAPIGHGVPVTP